MAVDLVLATSPVILGLSIEIAVLLGLFILRVPLELAVLILIPFNIVVVGTWLPALIPVIGIISGILIGFMFLRIVRR